jgi:hypothetical protein
MNVNKPGADAPQRPEADVSVAIDAVTVLQLEQGLQRVKLARQVFEQTIIDAVGDKITQNPSDFSWGWGLNESGTTVILRGVKR